jgi:glycosyltransferase involved in cell wall biosynthesis
MNIPPSELTLLLPVYNEIESLHQLLPKLQKLTEEHGWKMLLVNDGSIDVSADKLEELCARHGAKVVHHKVNRGYGGAIKSGIQHVETRYVATIDADGQHDSDEIREMVALMEKSDADLVVGTRAGQPSATWLRGFGKWLIKVVAARLMDHGLTDLQSGFKLFRSDLAKEFVNLLPDGFAACDALALLFVSQGHKVVEKQIHALERTTGVSKIRYSVVFETVNEIIHLVFLFNPIRIFFPISLFLFVLGCLWGIPYLFAGRGLSVGASVLVMGGGNTFLLGLISEQISRMRRPQHRP